MTSCTIFDEFVSYGEKYSKEFDKFLCLIEVGGFHEVYSCNVEEMKIISELLNISYSKKNKSIVEVSRTNYLLCGFPTHSLPKFLKILLDNQFTVIVITQVSPPPKCRRAVTQIISPSTYISDEISSDSNNLMSIYFDDAKTHSIIAVSIIDLSTGRSQCTEFSCPDKNKIAPPLDELFRLILSVNPKEIVLTGTLTTLKFDDVISYLDISKKCIHDKIGKTPKEFLQLNFANQFLKKIFPNTGLISPIEFIGLERHPTALISYILLIQFAYNHSEQIVKKISIPTIIQADTNLSISYNAIKQLNIDELNEILNKSSTAIGKRFFKERLYNPHVDPKKIESSFDSIEKLLNDKLYIPVKKKLDGIYDLERIFRRIQLNTINPCNFNLIIQSLENIILLEGPTASHDLLSHCREYLDEIECSKYNIDTIQSNFFNKTKYPDTDLLQVEYNSHLNFFNNLLAHLNAMCQENNFFKLENTERDGYYFSITSKRFDEVKKQFKDNKFQNILLNDLTSKPISSSSNVFKISHDYFKTVNSNIVSSKERLVDNILVNYAKFLKETEEKFGAHFTSIVNFIAETDFSATCAELAFNNRYVRPTISDSDSSSSSFINIKGLRHPIVENIQKEIEYISNDIELNSSGMLLYGLNSSGKSTLSKSIGIATIMAQSGMYVAAESMELKPYRTIFSRIPCGDNIMQGQSTFVIEVSELRNILKNADRNSLVIGDELCSGTESVSAIAIVGAGIVELCKREASFIFASHLHELVNIKRLIELEKEAKLKVCHLNVVYDEVTDKLIYDRKLVDGHGNSLYGLEVCRSLAIGDEFYALANEIRREILNVDKEILPTKKSKYNADKIIDNCEICGSKCEEVHHINQQYLADSDGFIGQMHKNSLYNLVCVCSYCHDAIHENKIIIDGKKMTSNGPELIFKTKEIVPDTRADEETVKTYYKEGKSITEILKILNEKNDNSITRYRINKIVRSL